MTYYMSSAVLNSLSTSCDVCLACHHMFSIRSKHESPVFVLENYLLNQRKIWRVGGEPEEWMRMNIMNKEHITQRLNQYIESIVQYSHLIE